MARVNCPQDNCLDELAEYLHEKDLRSDLNGKQNAVSYMIGFTLDFPLLARPPRRVEDGISLPTPPRSCPALSPRS